MRRSCRHRPNRKLTNSTTGIRFAQGLKPVRGSEALNTIPCVVNVTGLVLSELPFLQAGLSNGCGEKASQRRHAWHFAHNRHTHNLET